MAETEQPDQPQERSDTEFDAQAAAEERHARQEEAVQGAGTDPKAKAQDADDADATEGEDAEAESADDES